MGSVCNCDKKDEDTANPLLNIKVKLKNPQLKELQNHLKSLDSKVN